MENELAFVKHFLRIDSDEDDQIVSLLLQAAKDYIVDAIGRFDDENARHWLLACNIISTLYDNRVFTVSSANEKVQYALQSMVVQLQLEGESHAGG